ncbi:MAG: DUF4434 domain-containing protein [Ruminococcus sp.]
MKKFILTAIALCLSVTMNLSGVFSIHAQAETSHIEKIDGTFIQPWLYMTYDEEQWNNEMQALKDIGIRYLIMGDVANHNSDGTWTVYYPSELPYLSDSVAYDALEPLLYYCDKYDIQLYLGMGLDCAWNSDIVSEEGRKANRDYMKICNEITTEIFNQYKSRYPDTYYGFYFVTELYNTIYMETDEGIDAYADGLDEMFTMVIDNCNALDSSMPLLFSPYVNIFGYGYASINVDRFTEYWTEVFSRIPFRNGDMVCPQDSCGGGGMDAAHLSEWTKAYRNAVDRSNEIRGTKLLLGTNAEMFVQPDAYRMSVPNGVSYSGIKNVRDFTTRLETADEYVDSLFCFAYPHHYSPYNTEPQFHACLKTYLKTGEIETEKPTSPTNVEIRLTENEGKQIPEFTFTGMADNTAVVHTNIYRNGKLYDYIVPAVKVGGNKTQNVWTDYNFKDDTAVYEVECMDVCGNVSDKCSFSFDWNELKEKGSLSVTTSDAAQWNMTSLDYLSYTVTDYGVRINGCDKNAVDIMIPDEIEGKPVTVIDWYAFERCSKLKSVVIPETVTHISRFAFAHCISLESVNLPASLYSIEQYAFYDCPKLMGITLPESLNIIEERAFCGCKSISEITIPESCQSIGDYAFLGCDSLNTITINGENTSFGIKSMGYEYNNGYGVKDGFLLISESENAAGYAKDNGIKLVSEMIPGDVNSDGIFNIADVVLLQKWILAVPDTHLAYRKAADLCEDGKINVFDLCLAKRMMLEA